MMNNKPIVTGTEWIDNAGVWSGQSKDGRRIIKGVD